MAGLSPFTTFTSHRSRAEMSESQQRRSTRIAAQPKKEEAPKPAAKPRKQPNKRPAAEEGTDAVEEKEKPATKKVRVFVDVSFVVRCFMVFREV